VHTPFPPDFLPGEEPGDFGETLNRITMLLSGQLAERRHAGRWNHVGAGPDWREASHLARSVTRTDAECNALLKWLRLRADSLLEHLWPSVEGLAAAFLSEKTLTPERAREVYALAQRMPKEERATDRDRSSSGGTE
jgi:hypothetical protein